MVAVIAWLLNFIIFNLNCNQYIFSNSKMIFLFCSYENSLPFHIFLRFDVCFARIILKLQSSQTRDSRKYQILFEFSINIIRLVPRIRKWVFELFLGEKYQLLTISGSRRSWNFLLLWIMSYQTFLFSSLSNMQNSSFAPKNVQSQSFVIIS